MVGGQKAIIIAQAGQIDSDITPAMALRCGGRVCRGIAAAIIHRTVRVGGDRLFVTTVWGLLC